MNWFILTSRDKSNYSDLLVEIIKQMRQFHRFKYDYLFFDELIPSDMKFFDIFLFQEMKKYRKEEDGDLMAYFNEFKSKWYELSQEERDAYREDEKVNNDLELAA